MYFMSDPQALHVTRNVIPGKLGVDLHLHRVHIPLVVFAFVLFSRQLTLELDTMCPWCQVTACVGRHCERCPECLHTKRCIFLWWSMLCDLIWPVTWQYCHRTSVQYVTAGCLYDICMDWCTVCRSCGWSARQVGRLPGTTVPWFLCLSSWQLRKGQQSWPHILSHGFSVLVLHHTS